jgi:hypothetical protein
MINKKVSPEPILQITRAREVVIVEYICDKEDTYQWSEYSFNNAEERAKRFEEDLQWVANIVNGLNFSYYANGEEVMIDCTDLVSISIATGDAGCAFIQH